MLSRVMGYHAREHASVRPRYSWLEGRLNFMAAVPGAVLTIGTGLWLILQAGGAWFRLATWLHWKLALVLGALVIHAIVTRKQRQLVRNPPDAAVPRALFAALHGTLGLVLLAILLLVMHRPMG